MYLLKTYTELEIGHRLMTSYAQKCRHCHGHCYKVEIGLKASQLNEDGMVIDFKKIKEIVKQELDDKWDHGFAINANDPLRSALEQDKETERLHIMSVNPTLEHMVQIWYCSLKAALARAGIENVQVAYVEASETTRNTCRYTED